MALYERNEVKEIYNDTIFGSPLSDTILPRYEIPKYQHAPDSVFQIIRDELVLDGNDRQNLCTFCQTWEEKQVRKLMDLSINKNLIDKDEYPQTAEIEERCVNMIANLWNAPEGMNPIGTSGVGSSEGCMLGGLAMLWRWRKRRKEAGLSIDKPNLVCGPVQVVWKKFCLYWDIEIREVPMEKGRYEMTPESMLERVDENTICVVPTFGLTFTGMYESVKDLSDALDKLEEEKGIDVDIHVDGASGAFIAPFCTPDILWDFRVNRVKSISASGHKYGLSPLGAGWVVWKDVKYLPEELIFKVNYLGGDMPVFQINFSRPAGQIVSQYYLFLRLGYEGYNKVHNSCFKTAQYIAAQLEKMDLFEIIHGGDPEKGIPVVSWKFRDDVNPVFNLYDLADRLRTRGWQVPAYSLPKNAEDIVVQRVVCRQGFSLDMADLFVQDVKKAIGELREIRVTHSFTEAKHGGFRH